MTPLHQYRRMPTVLIVALPLVAARASAVGVAGQRLAAEATVAALPEPLGAFFAARVEGVIERAIEPDGAWRGEPRTGQREDWHYLALDAAAAGDSWPERRAAAMAFPAQWTAAQRLFREHGVKHGGRLPWELDGLVGELAEAFARRDEAGVVRAAGYIVHFAGDAGDPFATSRRGGCGCGENPAVAAELGDPWFAHRDAAQRIGWELIRRNAQRYREALAPQDVRFELGVDDVPFAVLECMVSSFDQLEALCAADREVLGQMGVAADGRLDAGALLARQDEYYLLMDGRVGPVCVQNLRRSVRLGATLIVTAWLRAGSPDPSVAPVVAAPPASAPPATPAASAGPAEKTPPAASPPPAAAPSNVRFVASRNSKIYHRSDCSHAARISAGNRVEYASRAEAEADGKRPCQTCRPDQAEGG